MPSLLSAAVFHLTLIPSISSSSVLNRLSPSAWFPLKMIRSISRRPHMYTGVMRYDLASLDRGPKHAPRTPASASGSFHIPNLRVLVFRDEDCLLDLAWSSPYSHPSVPDASPADSWPVGKLRMDSCAHKHIPFAIRYPEALSCVTLTMGHDFIGKMRLSVHRLIVALSLD